MEKMFTAAMEEVLTLPLENLLDIHMKVLQQRHTRVAGTFLEGKRAHAGGCRTGARHRKRIGTASA